MKSNAIVREARAMSEDPSPKQPQPGRKKQPGRLPSMEARPEWNPSVGRVPSFFGERNHYRAAEPYRPPQDCVHRDLADDKPPFITALAPSHKFRPIGYEFEAGSSPKALPPIRSKSEERPARSKSAGRSKVPAPPADPQPKTARNSKPKKEKPAPSPQQKAETKKKEEKTDKNLFVDGKLIMDSPKELKRLFKRLDGNASGQLSLAELDLGVKSLYPGFDNKPAIMRAYKAADSSGEGFIGLDEFKFFMQFLVYYNNLWDAFAAADDDDDRRMDLDEFKDIAPALDIDEPEETFGEIDTNGGGFILFEEFCIWIAKNRPGLEIELSRAVVDTEEKEDTASHQPKTNKAPVVANTDAVPDAAAKIQVPPKKECMELFNRLDPNGNGMLSLAELDKGVIELWPELNNKPAIMRAYKAADRDGEGFVTRGEFGYFLRFLQYYNNLWSDFCAADDDGDRRITKDEFMNDAEKLQLDDPAAVFDEMDTNGGGVVLFDEFCAWMATNKSDWGGDDNDGNESVRSPTPAADSVHSPTPVEADAEVEEAPAAEEEPAAEETDDAAKADAAVKIQALQRGRAARAEAAARQEEKAAAAKAAEEKATEEEAKAAAAKAEEEEAKKKAEQDEAATAAAAADAKEPEPEPEPEPEEEEEEGEDEGSNVILVTGDNGKEIKVDPETFAVSLVAEKGTGTVFTVLDANGAVGLEFAGKWITAGDAAGAALTMSVPCDDDTSAEAKMQQWAVDYGDDGTYFSPACRKSEVMDVVDGVPVTAERSAGRAEQQFNMTVVKTDEDDEEKKDATNDEEKKGSTAAEADEEGDHPGF